LALQEHQVKEHIFVFDGWYEKWAEIEILSHLPSAQLIRLERNVGQGSARNLGVKKSSCKWVAFLDQDDLWEPNHISDLIFGTRYGEFSLGYSDIKEIDSDGFVTVQSMMYNTIVLGMNNLIKKEISDLLFRDLMIFPSSAIVDRVKFDSVGGFAEHLKGHEDDFGFRKLLQAHPNHFYCATATASWRTHSSGTSGSISMSESRVAYSKMLLSEFQDDVSIKKGVSTRLSKSFLRELIAVASNPDPSQFDLYRGNCVAFLNVTKELKAPIKFRYRIAFTLKNPQLLLLIVNILKFLRRLLTTPKFKVNFEYGNPFFPGLRIVKFLVRQIRETK
jgi:glycosyltransferase involved in cell wall biosynthesis